MQPSQGTLVDPAASLLLGRAVLFHNGEQTVLRSDHGGPECVPLLLLEADVQSPISQQSFSSSASKLGTEKTVTAWSLRLLLSLFLSFVLAAGYHLCKEGRVGFTLIDVLSSPIAACSDAEASVAILYTSEVTSVVAWKSALRTSAPTLIPHLQEHTAVCINFNTPPFLESLATVLKVQSSLHRYLTLVSPVPLQQLPISLPIGLHYIECVQGSILQDENPDFPPVFVGHGGTLQHVCAAACFEYYATRLPHIRGVLWQSDDMFVNYSMLFDASSPFAPDRAWSPGRGGVFALTDDFIFRMREYWTNQPIANLFSLRYTAQLLQSDNRYRKAWLLAYGAADFVSEKVIADFFYLPRDQLQIFADITSFLASSSQQFVTVPDVSEKTTLASAASINHSISLRVGLTMSEWWLETQLHLTAAVRVLELQTPADKNDTDLSSRLLHAGASMTWIWGDARMDLSLLRDLCFHIRYDGLPPAVIHPLKLTIKEQRELFVEGYKRMQETWLEARNVGPM